MVNPPQVVVVKPSSDWGWLVYLGNEEYGHYADQPTALIIARDQADRLGARLIIHPLVNDEVA